MTTRSRVKTEHADAKNGGGYDGTRVEAKRESDKKRRRDDRAEVEERLGDEVTAGDALDLGGARKVVPAKRTGQAGKSKGGTAGNRFIEAVERKRRDGYLQKASLGTAYADEISRHAASVIRAAKDVFRNPTPQTLTILHAMYEAIGIAVPRAKYFELAEIACALARGEKPANELATRDFETCVSKRAHFGSSQIGIIAWEFLSRAAEIDHAFQGNEEIHRIAIHWLERHMEAARSEKKRGRRACSVAKFAAEVALSADALGFSADGDISDDVAHALRAADAQFKKGTEYASVLSTRIDPNGARDVASVLRFLGSKMK
jgi:hypothetical protein